jgi:hypothetical protein
MVNKFTDVVMTVLIIAGITAVLLPGRAQGAADIIKAGGSSFQGVIKAATGQK